MSMKFAVSRVAAQMDEMTSPTDARIRRRLPQRRRPRRRLRRRLPQRRTRLWFDCTFPFVFVMIIISFFAHLNSSCVDVADFHSEKIPGKSRSSREKTAG